MNAFSGNSLSCVASDEELELSDEELELFGSDGGASLSDEEFDALFAEFSRTSPRSHEECVGKLRALRAARHVKPKSFAKRITPAGRIHAYALGIRLEA